MGKSNPAFQLNSSVIKMKIFNFLLGNIQFDFGGDVRVQKLEDLLTIDESELRVRMNEASLTSKRKRQDTTPSKPGTRRNNFCTLTSPPKSNCMLPSPSFFRHPSFKNSGNTASCFHSVSK
jgi:hypothetical protein